MKPAQRMNELQERLEELSHAYYVLDEPRTSDAEYDALLRELDALEEAHPELVPPSSFTSRVGAPPRDDFPPVTHRQRMLSLANALNDDDIRSFVKQVETELGSGADSIEFTFEPKVDGIGLGLIYEDGILITAATRGDGKTGEDVTPNVQTIRSIPLRLRTEKRAAPAFIEIRGEVYTEVKRFEAFNNARTEEEGRYANPRNFTGGSLRQLDSRVTAARPLDALFYATGHVEGVTFETHMDLIRALEDWGLMVANPYIKCVAGAENLVEAHASLEAGRNDVPYDIDGSVLKVNELKLRQILGDRSRSPRWAIACKFTARQAATRLEGIEIGVGRTGALTPVALLAPVELAGVRVQHATLHNAEEIERLDLRIGDRVLVERAGDVIPKVVKSLADERDGSEVRFVMPKRCPVCDTPTQMDEEEVVIRCPNARCEARVKAGLLHFTGKDAFDIEGIGGKIVEQLVDRKLVMNGADLFSLTTEQLLELERMGQKSADKILANINAARITPLPRVIFGLGIRHVGANSASLIAEAANNLQGILTITEEDLEAIHDIGGTVAKSLVSWREDPDNLAFVTTLLDAGIEARLPEAQFGAGVLYGLTFVITGTLPSLSRKEAENVIKAEGGKPVGSVSKKTSYLLAGEKAGSKLKKAEALGIPVLTEEDLEELINERRSSLG